MMYPRDLVLMRFAITWTNVDVWLLSQQRTSIRSLLIIHLELLEIASKCCVFEMYMPLNGISYGQISWPKYESTCLITRQLLWRYVESMSSQIIS